MTAAGKQIRRQISALIERRYRRLPKAHSTSGQKKKSTMRSVATPRFSTSITASNRMGTRRKEAIRTTNFAGKTF
jgi:hypothetical protein